MAHHAVRILLFVLVAGLGFGVVSAPAPAIEQPGNDIPGHPQRPVFLAGKLSDEQLIVLTANLAGSSQRGVLLIDSPASEAQNKAFLAAYQPGRLMPVGSFPEGIAALEKRLGVKVGPILAWNDGQPAALWSALFPQARRVVVCPPEPRPLLLQAACLAGVLQAPLFITRNLPEEAAELRPLMEQWQTHEVFAISNARRLCRDLPGVHVVKLTSEQAVASSYLRHQLKKGSVRTLVVANPADGQRGLSAMSVLAPWVALQRRAALLLTNEAGDNVTALVHTALENDGLQQAEALLLLADLKAIPMEHRPNPIAGGKDQFIEMEPLTPSGEEPFSFATGRLFSDDPSKTALVLARRQLLAEHGPACKALVVADAGSKLELMETLSRTTAQELQNRGYRTTALFGHDANKDDLRTLMPEQDVILWEGHYSTLVKDYGLPEWTEPLGPSLVFLQSCLALNEVAAQGLLQRGAIGVVGTSTRTYASSGGAFALAYFDALLYDRQSVGSALRQAKNFMLAYSLLKQKRLGKEARMTGANLRSAWAFTLWGDPTLQMPRAETPEDALPPVEHQVHGRTIVVKLPEAAHEQTASSKYRAKVLPNGRLAGLLTKEKKTSEEDSRRLVPFVFAEVHFPNAPAGKVPHLHGRVPESHWVFCWDSRRRCGYLLVTPRARDSQELRFHVDWEMGDQRAAVRPGEVGAKN